MFYVVIFVVVYIIMLLVMSYNGVIIFLIIVGVGFGKFFMDWLSLMIELGGEEDEKKVEGIEELIVCC